MWRKMKRFEKWKRISALKLTGSRAALSAFRRSNSVLPSVFTVIPLHSDAAVDALAAFWCRIEAATKISVELDWKANWEANNEKNLKYQKKKENDYKASGCWEHAREKPISQHLLAVTLAATWTRRTLMNRGHRLRTRMWLGRVREKNANRFDRKESYGVMWNDS